MKIHHFKLTKKEYSIFNYVVKQGYSYKEIASAEGISLSTVKKHASSILNKLGYSSFQKLTVRYWKDRVTDLQKRIRQ